MLLTKWRRVLGQYDYVRDGDFATSRAACRTFLGGLLVFQPLCLVLDEDPPVLDVWGVVGGAPVFVEQSCQ